MIKLIRAFLHFQQVILLKYRYNYILFSDYIMSHFKIQKVPILGSKSLMGQKIVPLPLYI